MLLALRLSRPTRGAWIEIHQRFGQSIYFESRPTRGAWIEIGHVVVPQHVVGVAPHTGRVD